MSTSKLVINYGVINAFLKFPRYVSLNEDELGTQTPFIYLRLKAKK